MKLIAFYEPLEGSDEKNERKLIRLWKRVWRGYGFDPVLIKAGVIVDESEMENLDVADKKFKTFPTVNGGKFDFWCFMRWFWLSYYINRYMNDETVIFTDYDVFPETLSVERLRLFPDFIEAAVVDAAKRGKILSGDLSGGPGWIAGRHIDFEEILEWMLEYEPKPEDQVNGKPHVSDMMVLQANRHRFEARDWVKCYAPEDDRMDSRLIHFGNAYMKKEKPKWIEIMEALRL